MNHGIIEDVPLAARVTLRRRRREHREPRAWDGADPLRALATRMVISRLNGRALLILIAAEDAPEEGRSMSQVARACGLSPAATSLAADRLERLGLLRARQRETRPDRRIIHLALAPAGRQKLAELRAIADAEGGAE